MSTGRDMTSSRVPALVDVNSTGVGPGNITRERSPDLPLFRGRKPVALAFGTSGLRGLVSDITDLETYINTRGFLDYLSESGGAQAGDTVSLASDLRPSSDSADRSIVRAVALAVEHAGFGVDYLGPMPTPALMYHALQHGRPSIMVTGSHIPFDRNGIKFNTARGEVLKSSSLPRFVNPMGFCGAWRRTRHRTRSIHLPSTAVRGKRKKPLALLCHALDEY